MRRARPRALLAASLALTALVSCGDGAPRYGAPDPASESGEKIRDLWQGFFLAAVAVGAVMLGLILYAAVRFRRRDDRIPGQRSGSHLAEAIYLGVPVTIVAVLFAVSTLTERDVTDRGAEPDLTVRVTGFQWGWKFSYPGHDIEIIGTGEKSPPVLVLPEGRLTRLELRSTDVNHAFWVPQFMEKRDLIPGVDNDIDVKPTRTGTFEGRCAEYCGLDHWRMNFRARVVPGDDFDQWLAEGGRS